MKARCSSRFLLFLLLGALAAQPTGAATVIGALPPTPGIAKITSYTTSSRDGEEPRRIVETESLGFVVEADGHLLTSYRTLLDSAGVNLLQDIEVELIDGPPPHVYAASIVGVEPTLGFAILKIEPVAPLKVSKIVDREDIVPGQAIHAVADFEGGRPVLADGRITKLNSMECYQDSMTSTLLEAEIGIPDRSLGGPIFNDRGEVVALHIGYVVPEDEAIDVGESAGQHILPIFLAFNIYESLKLRGTLKSPWTGFSVRPLTTEEASIFPTPERFLGGIAIDYVWDDSPAKKLGIQEGDILVALSYYPTKSPAEFQKWLYDYGVGGKVVMKFIRDGHRVMTYDYTIEERPAWAKPR